MNRSSFSVLALCFALGACGEKFVANGGSGGNAGISSAGDAHGMGDAGAGGTAGNGAGTGDAGSGTGAVGGAPVSGGTGGVAGAIEPPLPQLGLLIWLSADRGIQQDDGRVQAWLDQSGNQMDATQMSPNERPSYLAEGFNGRPTLEFDGQGQFLHFDEGFGDFSKGLTGLSVSKPTLHNCEAILELSNGSEMDDIFLGVSEAQWQYEVEVPYYRTGSVDQERFSLFSVNHRPIGKADLRVNGSLLNTFDMPLPIVPESGVRVNNFIGHSLYNGCGYFQGQISELILYSRTLTNVELTAIEKYLAAHWALGVQAAPAP